MYLLYAELKINFTSEKNSDFLNVWKLYSWNLVCPFCKSLRVTLMLLIAASMKEHYAS